MEGLRTKEVVIMDYRVEKIKETDEFKEAKEFIDTKIEKKQFIELIERTSIVAWNEQIKERKINEWLTNFTGECFDDVELEQKLALWLLLNFTFYTINDVKKLCVELFEQFLSEELKHMEFEEEMDRNDKIKKIMDDVCFVPLGNPSESGARISYDFRTVNGLGRKLFEGEKKKYRCLVLIDDVTISGSQADEYLKKCEIEADTVYFLVFMATPKAINNIKDKNIKLIYSILLDSRTKCFSRDSFVFQGEQEKKIKLLAMILCVYYGKKIMSIFSDEYMKKYPWGYNCDQQMLGFYYNTPDNTMPIFWCDENWKSIFLRYNKIYGKGKVEFDDEQYI